MSTGDVRNNKPLAPADTLKDSDLSAAIARLPAIVRWIVILGERDGLSAREIANLAGVSLDLVKAMQSRGLALIQEDPLIQGGEAS